MTAKELQTIEAELHKRGYKKYTTGLTSTESYAWFKTFDKEKDDDDYVISGYQIAFRVWDFRKYVDRNAPPYGFDFWTSPLGSAFRTDFTSNWEPICDIDTFERMAAEFNRMVRKYVKPEPVERIIKRKKMDNLIESLRELPREALKLIIFSLMREDKVSFHELAEMHAKHLEALHRGATEQCQKIIGMIVNMHCDKKKNQEKNLKEIMHYLSDKGIVNVTHEQIDKK